MAELAAVVTGAGDPGAPDGSDGRRPLSDTLEKVGSAVAVGLLERVPARDGRYRFSHSLARQAVLQTLTEADLALQPRTGRAGPRGGGGGPARPRPSARAPLRRGDLARVRRAGLPLPGRGRRGRRPAAGVRRRRAAVRAGSCRGALAGPPRRPAAGRGGVPLARRAPAGLPRPLPRGRRGRSHHGAPAAGRRRARGGCLEVGRAGQASVDLLRRAMAADDRNPTPRRALGPGAGDRRARARLRLQRRVRRGPDADRPRPVRRAVVRRPAPARRRPRSGRTVRRPRSGPAGRGPRPGRGELGVVAAGLGDQARTAQSACVPSYGYYVRRAAGTGSPRPARWPPRPRPRTGSRTSPGPRRRSGTGCG